MNEMGENYTRRIQKTGSATFTVSLPKAWITKNNLKSGDSVSIIEDKDHSLRIDLGNTTPKLREETINIAHYANDREVIRKFTALYLNGANRINVTSEKPLSRDSLKNILTQVKKVVGFEIVEETDHRIVLQDFFTSDFLSIEKAMRRAHTISKLILTESTTLPPASHGFLDNVILWEQEVDRLELLVRRQLNFAIHSSITLKHLKLSLAECQYYLIVIGCVEKITDAFVEIAKIRTRPDAAQKANPSLKHSYDEVLRVYDQSFNSVFAKDFHQANVALDDVKRLIQQTHTGKAPKEWEVGLIIFNLSMVLRFMEEIAEGGLDIC